MGAMGDGFGVVVAANDVVVVVAVVVDDDAAAVSVLSFGSDLFTRTYSTS